MKKTTFLFLLLLNGMFAFAQSQIFEAKTADNTCKRMTITYKNGVAYVSTQSIAFNANIDAGISDAASVKNEIGKFVIPEGSAYWVVSYDGTTSKQMPSGEYCPDCSCPSGSTGTCFQTSGSKCKGTCDDCEASVKFCGGEVFMQGSAAIIKATKIVFN